VKKKWYQSKTVWLNTGIVLVSIQQSLPQVEEFIDPKTYAIALFFIGVLNLVLRGLTTKGITIK